MATRSAVRIYALDLLLGLQAELSLPFPTLLRLIPISPRPGPSKSAQHQAARAGKEFCRLGRSKDASLDSVYVCLIEQVGLAHHKSPQLAKAAIHSPSFQPTSSSRVAFDSERSLRWILERFFRSLLECSQLRDTGMRQLLGTGAALKLQTGQTLSACLSSMRSRRSDMMLHNCCFCAAL